MKKILALLLAFALLLSLVGCLPNKPGDPPDPGVRPPLDVVGHTDSDSNGFCDDCNKIVLTTFDFYAVNDLHGKFRETGSTIGVAGMSTYLKSKSKYDDNPIFLSSGDMWQGAAVSNLTKGLIVTDWMNSLGFVSMTLGNHEFDWGEEYIAENEKLANFPFLAINVYDVATNKPVEYVKPSVIVETRGLQVGIIGAIGDTYSSISQDKVTDVYFKTGSQLTSLVKAEAERLRAAGCELVVYSLHDGYGSSSSGSYISDSQLSSYYDISISDYVDLVFEGHTHKGYALRDSKGVYHLQNSGDNGGISHVEIAYNFANGEFSVNEARHVRVSEYSASTPDPIIDELLTKYKDSVDKANEVLGMNSKVRLGDDMCATIAMLYLEAGIEKWGSQYNIVLGGGFMSVRAPYNLKAGEVTYGDVQGIFTFDNPLVLCSVEGRYLKSKFLQTSNENYFIYCGEYGQSVKDSIDDYATYYIITDTYTSGYPSNRLTEIARYDEVTFARDLLAEYIKEGNYA